MAMIDTIRALMAKAERTDNEHERDAYLAKAQELMFKHAVSEGMLAAAGNRSAEDRITMKTIFADSKGQQFIKARRELWWGLADLNRIKIVVTGRNGRDATWAYGYVADLEFVEIMYASLDVQLTRALAANRPSGATRSWAVSFAHGYVRRVIARLRDAQAAQMAGSDVPGTALVIRNRKDDVDAYVAERLNNLRRVRMTTSNNDMGGYNAGAAAGNQADLGGRRVGSTSNARRLGN